MAFGVVHSVLVCEDCPPDGALSAQGSANLGPELDTVCKEKVPIFIVLHGPLSTLTQVYQWNKCSLHPSYVDSVIQGIVPPLADVAIFVLQRESHVNICRGRDQGQEGAGHGLACGAGA